MHTRVRPDLLEGDVIDELGDEESELELGQPARARQSWS